MGLRDYWHSNNAHWVLKRLISLRIPDSLNHVCEDQVNTPVKGLGSCEHETSWGARLRPRTQNAVPQILHEQKQARGEAQRGRDGDDFAALKKNICSL